MKKVVLDTDVSSRSFQGRLAPDVVARLARCQAFMSFATLGELTKWHAMRPWGRERRARLRSWQRGVTVVRYDERVAVLWGELQGRAERRGRPRPANDTWIAASCIIEGVPLATFNTKDFEDFATYDGLRLFDVA
ncbi:PIN domain-containing protein [Catenuloplanes sp. NPDC051500]|uniref:PIN domain-containing protein n=1 Tax=Catenuloplanes sp. NPDC051500 TaxID=3363959 RepID=UPI00378C72B8